MSDAIVYYFGNTGPTGQRAIKTAQTQMAGAGRRWRCRRCRGAQRGLRQGHGRQHPRLVAGRRRRGHHQHGIPGRMGFAHGRRQVGADQPDPPAAAAAAARVGQQPHLCHALGRHLRDTRQPGLQHRAQLAVLQGGQRGLRDRQECDARTDGHRALLVRRSDAVDDASGPLGVDRPAGRGTRQPVARRQCRPAGAHGRRHVGRLRRLLAREVRLQPRSARSATSRSTSIPSGSRS